MENNKLLFSHPEELFAAQRRQQVLREDLGRQTGALIEEQERTQAELWRKIRIAAILLNHYQRNLEQQQTASAEAKEKAKEALIDPLTQLLNRRGFTEAMQLLQRDNDEGVLLILDTDKFKEINDKKGHLAGDHVLRTTAKHLIEQSRDTDIVARWGGDEFVIFFPGATVEQILKKFQLPDNLKKPNKEYGTIISVEPLKGKNEPILEGKLIVRMSGGITAYSPKNSIENGIQQADDALYRAKNGGRGYISK